MILSSIREKFFDNRPFAPEGQDAIKAGTLNQDPLDQDPLDIGDPLDVLFLDCISYNCLSFACDMHNSIMRSNQSGLTKFVEVLTLSVSTGIGLTLLAVAETCLCIALDILLGSIAITCIWLSNKLLGDKWVSPLDQDLTQFFQAHVMTFLIIVEAPKVAYRMMTEYQTICRPQLEIKSYPFQSLLPILPVFDMLKGVKFEKIAENFKLIINSDNVDWGGLKADPRLSNVTEIRGGPCITSFSLPEGLQRSILKSVNLSNCSNLTSLDESIYHLPPNCDVDLTNTSLPQDILEKIKQTSHHPDYNGPRSLFDMSKGFRFEELREGLMSLTINSDNVDWETLKNDPRLSSVAEICGGFRITSFSLPKGLQLPNLKLVNFCGCESLSYLNESTIYQLPPTCTVDLMYTGLDQTILASIKQKSAHYMYVGPRFKLPYA